MPTRFLTFLIYSPYVGCYGLPVTFGKVELEISTSVDANTWLETATKLFEIFGYIVRFRLYFHFNSVCLTEAYCTSLPKLGFRCLLRKYHVLPTTSTTMHLNACVWLVAGDLMKLLWNAAKTTRIGACV